MKNKASSKPADLLMKALPQKATNEGEGLNEQKIVLPDECGDSLWDEVLKQQEVTPVLTTEGNDCSGAKPIKK